MIHKIFIFTPEQAFFFQNVDFKRSIHTINASRKYSQGTDHFRQLF